MTYTADHADAERVTADDLHFYTMIILPESGLSHVPAESLRMDNDGVTVATVDGRPVDEVDPTATEDGFWVDLAEQDRG